MYTADRIRIPELSTFRPSKLGWSAGLLVLMFVLTAIATKPGIDRYADDFSDEFIAKINEDGCNLETSEFAQMCRKYDPEPASHLRGEIEAVVRRNMIVEDRLLWTTANLQIDTDHPQYTQHGAFGLTWRGN